MKKVVIELHKILTAGTCDLVVYDNGITEDIRLCLNPGSPYPTAYREAELLATALDCYFMVGDDNVREPIKEV